MDGEIITRDQSFMTRTSLRLNVMVVDDDTTSLTIVAGILKTWKYEVLTVKHPIQALATLRMTKGLIDLVVTDIHMPDMNGFELQKQVDEEFKLPVIMMSGDDREDIMLKGLLGGAAFFLVKPLKADDLKNIWQLVVATRKMKPMVSQEIIFPRRGVQFEDRESASTVIEERPNSKSHNKRKIIKRGNEGEEAERKLATTQKKPKVVWTASLHSRFLQAVADLGYDNAVPTRILKYMNIKGLTRENIASHLQKYRLFMKRITEASGNSSENSIVEAERALRSSFTSPYAPVMFSMGHKQSQMRTFQTTASTPSSIGRASLYNKEPSSTNSMSQYGYGLPPLLSNTQAEVQQPSFRIRAGTNGTNHIMTSTNRLLDGTNGIMITNTMQHSLLDGADSNVAGINGLLNGTNSTQIFESFNNSHDVIPDSNYTNSNYEDFQGVGDGKLVQSSTQIGLTDDHNVVYNSTPEQKETRRCKKFTQGLPSSVGFETENQFILPFANVSQPEDTLVQPPPEPQQQNSFGGGTNSMVCDPIYSTSIFSSLSPLQSFGEFDLSPNFLPPFVHDQSLNQEIRGEKVISPDLTNNSLCVEAEGIAQILNQQGSGEEVMSNLYQPNGFFPCFDENLNQHDTGEFLSWELNCMYSTGAEELMDSMTGTGANL